MADTAHTHTDQDSAASRQIRVFLSSTFRDFMEERDLLVKQVFPSLRRRAQERGVEVVDVDLRWGVTQEESEQGKVIGICLAEIERCRPYFIGMLGERYGWTPGKTDYPGELFEREQLGWIRDHQGDASVTELEILHGVLNDKEMAGRAFFYFRDPAWSRGQSKPGFLCDTAEEEAKLAALKDRIRASGFPVAEDLPDPKAIADQIEADLWALIEEQYPDPDEADALEREARKHASYRQSRLGVYLGQEYIDRLEELIDGGEQKILITGESGSGKSALIANWMHQHALEHPGDVVYAHHLGCSNDANAIRPLLCRMLDTASKLLEEAELITEPIQVPEDWWELTAKLAETLQDLGLWCRKTGKRWIWVLDGLDRLAEDDQQALPWLPLLIPEGLSVVISALECPARAILLERQYQRVKIGPLQRNEQEQLIKTYLERYTKKLDSNRIKQILACELARSPLFLRALLEELRQCGRFETLESQIANYIKPNADGSLAVNDLYARILARLESECGIESVRLALTALWASRAGLSETELLAITSLAPLQWAPIDLTLEKALGRNGSRLTFDHDYLRRAVEDRYLPTEEHRLQIHSKLADWFNSRAVWDERDSEELPWQLQQAKRLSELKELIVTAKHLARLEQHRGSRETVNYWLQVRADGDLELDEMIRASVENEISRGDVDTDSQISFVDAIARVLDEAGLYCKLLLELRTLSLELEENRENPNRRLILDGLTWLARTHQLMGSLDKAEELYVRCLHDREQLLGGQHPETLISINNLGMLYLEKGEYDKAEENLKRCLEISQSLLGPEHPETLISVNNLGVLYADKNDYEQAEKLYTRCLETEERLLGEKHQSTLKCMNNLGQLYADKGDYRKAQSLFERCLEGLEHLLGSEHPDTLTAASNQGALFQDEGKYEQAEALYTRCLEVRERLMGPEHPDTLLSINNLGTLFRNKGDYEKARDFYILCSEGFERVVGAGHPCTITSINNLGDLLRDNGELDQAEVLYKRFLKSQEQVLAADHPETNRTRFRLANLLTDLERYEESIPLRRLELEVANKLDGRTSPGTLASIQRLAEDLYWADELRESEQLYREALAGRIASLGDDDGATMASRFGLARCLSDQERYSEAILLRRVELAWCRETNGDTDQGTQASINALAIDLRETGELEEAEALFRELVAARRQILPVEDFEIGRALRGLAKTLEEAGKLDESAYIGQEALDHRIEHEGPDSWWTNRGRMDQARVLQKLGQCAEAIKLLKQLQLSMENNVQPDYADTKLLEEAEALRRDLESSSS